LAGWVNQALAALLAWWGGGAAIVVAAVAVWRTLRFFRRPAATFWYLIVALKFRKLTCLACSKNIFLKLLIFQAGEIDFN
jgi:hypothetical protein